MTVVFGADPSHAQQAIIEGGANLLTPLNLLPTTAAGRAVLDANLATTLQIERNGTQTLRDQAMSDATGSPGNALNYAQGLGTGLFAAFSVGNKEFKTAAGVETDYTQVQSWRQLWGSINTINANTSSALRLLAGQGYATGTDWTGAGTSANSLGTPYTATLTLPAGGVYNVYDSYYGPVLPNSAGPGGTSEDTRPYFTRPSSYVDFTAVDFYGVTQDNLTFNILPAKNSISFPSGHSPAGWSGAITLAMLFPERWQQELTRGAEYANSRIVLGMHYATDVIAGRILATYNLVQMLNNNPAYTNLNLLDQRGVPLPQSSTSDYEALFNQTFTDLRASVAQACGMSIASCIASGAPDRFSDNAKNKAEYTYDLTYGLPPIGPTDLAPVVPVGAEVLLQTRFPYLTADQRRDVLATTEIASGGALDDGSGYARLNLYAAGDGYGAFNSQVLVNMNGALGGFNATDSWNNDITGTGGITLGGSGVLTFTGNDTYGGPTIVNGGALEIAGSIVSPTTVNAGGVLTGSGSVGNVTVNSGGTLAPGALASIGTLTINGTLTANVGSNYSVRTTTAASDSTRVLGTAALNGGNVVVTAAPTAFVIGTRYNILSTTEGVTGRFSGVTGYAPIATFVSLVDHYDPFNVYLDVTATFASAAATRNQTATAAGLNSLAPTNSLFSAVAYLPNVSSARSAFDQLSGEMHGSMQGQMIDDSRFVRNAGVDRIRAAYAAVGGSRAPVMAYNGTDPVLNYAAETPRTTAFDTFLPAPATTERLAFWAQGIGDWSHLGGNGNSSGLRRSTGGFIMGADTMLPNGAARIGLLGGIGQSNYSAPTLASSGSSNDYSFGAYGGSQWGEIGFRSGTSVTWHDIETNRQVGIAGFSDNLKGNYSATTAQVYGEVGYALRQGEFGLEPFVDLAYVDQRTNRFTESGGAAALTNAGGNTGVTFSTLGLHASSDIELMQVETALHGMLGWRHAFDNTATLTTVSFAGGTSFSTSGTPIAADALVVDAGIDLVITNSASIGLTYGAQLASGATSQTAKASFLQRF